MVGTDIREEWIANLSQNYIFTKNLKGGEGGEQQPDFYTNVKNKRYADNRDFSTHFDLKIININ